MWLPKKSIWVDNTLHAKQYPGDGIDAFERWLIGLGAVFNKNHRMADITVMGGMGMSVPGAVEISLYDGNQFVILEDRDWVWTINGQFFIWDEAHFYAFFENTAEEATEEEESGGEDA